MKLGNEDDDDVDGLLSLLLGEGVDKERSNEAQPAVQVLLQACAARGKTASTTRHAQCKGY